MLNFSDFATFIIALVTFPLFCSIQEKTYDSYWIQPHTHTHTRIQSMEVKKINRLMSLLKDKTFR